MNPTALFSGLSLTLLAGCSISNAADEGTASAQASLRAGCEAYAEALVAKQAECPVTESDLGAGASVEGALARTCESLFGAPGSGASESNLRACAVATSAASCTEYHGGLAECAAPLHGTLPKDDECLFDTQCDSGVCMGSTGASCGRCVDRAGAGERCGIGATDVPCEDSFVCLAITSTAGTCEPGEITTTKATADTACEGTCNNDWLQCRNGACVERGTTCRGTSYNYDCAYGQRCNAKGTDSPGTCEPGWLGQPGESCKAYNGTFCDPGLYCDSATNICRSHVQEGGTCSSAEDHCAEGLSCVAATCTVPVIDDYSCGGKAKQDSPWR